MNKIQQVIRIKNLILPALLTLLNRGMAQHDSAWLQSPSVTLSGFADVFYAYDFNEPTGGQRLPFFYNHNRHNEFNLNLGFVKPVPGNPGEY